MKNFNITIKNEVGLHARPAAVLVKKATSYKSNVFLIVGEKKYNAKSIMGVLSAGVKKGQEVVVEVDGEDEDIAIKDIQEAIESGLGE